MCRKQYTQTGQVRKVDLAICHIVRRTETASNTKTEWVRPSSCLSYSPVGPLKHRLKLSAILCDVGYSRLETREWRPGLVLLANCVLQLGAQTCGKVYLAAFLVGFPMARRARIAG